jgi:hypothetical protein
MDVTVFTQEVLTDVMSFCCAVRERRRESKFLLWREPASSLDRQINFLLYVKYVSCFAVFFVNVFLTWPPLLSSGQSSWLQIQRSGFDYRRYQIIWEAGGLERGPLCLVSTIEELLERKRSGSGLESRGYVCRTPLSCPRGTLYPQKLALTSPKSGGRSGTQATEFTSSGVELDCLERVFLKTIP